MREERKALANHEEYTGSITMQIMAQAFCKFPFV